MDTWVASTHWLLQVTLLWTWVDKYLFEFLLSVLDIYLGVELLNHMVILLKFSKNCSAISHCSCTILHPYIQCTRVPISPQPYQICYFLLLLCSERCHPNGYESIGEFLCFALWAPVKPNRLLEEDLGGIRGKFPFTKERKFWWL